MSRKTAPIIPPPPQSQLVSHFGWRFVPPFIACPLCTKNWGSCLLTLATDVPTGSADEETEAPRGYVT